MRISDWSSDVCSSDLKQFKGQIWQISSVIDPQTRQGVARIALSYAPALRPGGFASARIIAGSNQAPLLPESAVQSEGGQNYVYIVGKDDKVIRRNVTTGEVSDAGVAIAGGLDGRERVLVSPGACLHPRHQEKPVPKHRPHSVQHGLRTGRGK